MSAMDISALRTDPFSFERAAAKTDRSQDASLKALQLAASKKQTEMSKAHSLDEDRVRALLDDPMLKDL